ncbi:zinc transporter ZntB [Spongiibacter sp. KMU-158]|uniref:Zinc transporter ZntB n=1 Tax=Spongiibacter pelagi TaxID=2760804 RepID=A0A927BYB5_9GAMM|nr:zinc transporter ZntB [Spongiibacter pelagi]MBD2857803.1 zinc transporter ZntB [Spongiibacter pelagi]
MKDFVVYSYLLDGNGGAATLDEAGLKSWTPEQGVLWLHLNYDKPDVAEFLEQECGLDEITVAALTAGETRPRATAHAGGVLMALRGVNMNPNADPEDMVSIRLFATPQRIISTRKRRLLSVDDLVNGLQQNAGPASSAEFISLLCDRLVRRMSGLVMDLEEHLDTLEESLMNLPRNKLRSELSDVRRQCISLRRYLAPQREALSWFVSERLAWFGDIERAQVRETGDQLAQKIETLDSIRDRAGVAQEELVNQISEESNNRMYLLSIVSAIFLPLGFATGVLGVNVGGIPGADNADAFAIFVLGMAVIAGAMLAWFRYKKWV